MASDLYTHSQTLKSRAKNFDPNGQVTSLDYSSPLAEIKAAQGSAENHPELMEYWACIFLLSCEDNDPCIPKLGKDQFFSGFDAALGKISKNGDQRTLSLYAECNDGIVMNEILGFDEGTRIPEMIEVLEKLMKYFAAFDNYNFSFKTQVYNFLSQLWLKIQEFNEGEAPGESIIEVSKQLWIAGRCGVFVEEVSVVLADSIFEFIDYINQNQLDSPDIRHNVENIQISHKLINQLEEYCKDAEVHDKLKTYREKLTRIYPYQEVRPNNNELNLAGFQNINTIANSRLEVVDPSVYVVSRGLHKVTIGRYKLDGRTVCVKSYSLQPDMTDMTDISKINNEIDIYQKLSERARPDNCFLQYFGSCLEPNKISIVLEWYDNNLMEIINKRKEKNSKINELTFLEIALKLVRSFGIMAGINIFHNDIKPHNIMAIEDDWSMKIIDFDAALVKKSQDGTSYRGIQGTEGYNSPEKDKAKSKSDYDQEKADVYSLGLVLFQFLTYENVKNITNQEILKIIDNKISGFSQDTKDFLKKLLKNDPGERPNFNASLEFLNVVKETVTKSSQKRK